MTAVDGGDVPVMGVMVGVSCVLSVCSPGGWSTVVDVGEDGDVVDGLIGDDNECGTGSPN